MKKFLFVLIAIPVLFWPSAQARPARFVSCECVTIDGHDGILIQQGKPRLCYPYTCQWNVGPPK